MKFNTIQKSSTPEIIINEIMQHIKSGELKPGHKLPTERDMSQMFGVGRSSIREAIKGWFWPATWNLPRAKEHLSAKTFRLTTLP